MSATILVAFTLIVGFALIVIGAALKNRLASSLLIVIALLMQSWWIGLIGLALWKFFVLKEDT